MPPRRGSLPPDPSLRPGDRLDDLAERLEAVAADQRVAVLDGGEHAGRPRPRTRRAPTLRVDPDDPVGEAREALHLAADELRVAPLPAVGEDHDDGAAGHAAAAVAVVELLQRVADPGPARPVRRGRRGARWIARSGLRAASARVRRVSRVANTNASACGPAPAAQLQELQVGAGVGLHRAGDVAEHHQPAADDPAAAAGEVDRVAAGAQAAAQGPAQVDAPAVVGAARGGGCGAAASRARAATSAGRAARARPARARRSSCRASRSSSLAIASGTSSSAPLLVPVALAGGRGGDARLPLLGRRLGR